MKLLTSPFFVKLKKWFTPPVFEDQNKTLMARNSFSLALVGVTTSIFIFIFFLLFAPENIFRLLVIGVSIFFSYLPIVFLRKGHVRAVIYFQASIIWIGVVSTSISTGGVRSIGFIGGTIAALLIMGIALERISTAIFIFVSIVAAGSLAWAEAQGYIDTAKTTDNPIVLVATYASFLFVLAGLLYVTYRNVTQALAKANQELIERQRAEARLRSLVENSPATIVEINRKGEIVFTNSNPDLMLGINATQFLEPEDRAWVDQLIEQVFETGESKAIEVKVNVPGGTLRWNSLSFGPVFTGHEVTSLVIIATNINAQKEAELLVRQRAEQLATIVEISHTVSTLHDIDSVLEIIYQQVGRIVPVDAFFICLYDESNDRLSYPLTYDLGVRYEQGDSWLNPENPLADVIQNGKPFRLHRTPERMAELEAEDGDVGNPKLRSKSILFVPLWQADRVIGALSIQTYSYNSYPDELVEAVVAVGNQASIAIQNARLFTSVQQELAERRRIEDLRKKLIKELEQRNAELERLAYTLSHELKSPLITIRGFLGYLREDAVSGNIKRLEIDIQRITDGTEKMLRLINELIDLMSVGRIVHESEDIPLRALVDEAVQLVHERIVKNNVVVQITEDLPQVYGSRKQLLEVFQNLLENAIKFTGNQSQPRIEIGQKSEQSMPVFYVRDNGIGIEPRFADRIFGIFHKLDAQSEGTGIGLALVKRIIEVHGGKIWVESDGLGKGTTFCFTIPQ